MNRKRLVELIAPYNSISIIGMSKNAGKTTAMNKILKECREAGISLGITSIGRDGEEIDIATGTDKPKIFVAKGTLIATAAELLKKGDITKEVLQTTGINTPLGEVVIVRAKSDGYVQIGGSSIGSQISKLVQSFKELGSDKILIDGAISRKTFSNPIISDAAILSTGASFSADMSKVVSETVFTAKLLTTPALRDEKAKSAISALGEPAAKFSAIMPDYSMCAIDLDHSLNEVEGAKYIYINGALSDNLANKIIMTNMNLRGVKFVINDGSKLFISATTLEKIGLKGADIAVINPINLLAITINPISAGGHHFDKDAFKKAFEEHTEIPIYNVADEEA